MERRQFLGAAAALAALPATGEGDSDVTVPDPGPFSVVVGPAERPYDFQAAEVSIYPWRDGADVGIWLDVHGEWGEVSLRLDRAGASWIERGLARARRGLVDQGGP